MPESDRLIPNRSSNVRQDDHGIQLESWDLDTWNQWAEMQTSNGST